MSVPTLAPEIPTLVIESTDRAPAQARRFVAGHLRRWGCEDDYIARLIVTELVTNAYRHGDGMIVVRVYLDDQSDLAVIEVWDRSPRLPALVPQYIGATTGRGLHLVAGLAKDWGVRPTSEPGKVVWARCAR